MLELNNIKKIYFGTTSKKALDGISLKLEPGQIVGLFGENGDPLRVLTVNHDDGTEKESLYEYDTLGRNTRTVSYYDGALSSTLEKRYDDQGRILEEVWWDPDGIIFHRNTLSYTENTQTALDPEGYKTVITYRPDGQMEKMEIYAPSGELERLTEYIYSQIQIPAKEE